jgi:hypothetical protein
VCRLGSTAVQSVLRLATRALVGALTKGFRHICSSPLSLTSFLHMLAKSRNRSGERERDQLHNE